MEQNIHNPGFPCYMNSACKFLYFLQDFERFFSHEPEPELIDILLNLKEILFLDYMIKESQNT